MFAPDRWHLQLRGVPTIYKLDGMGGTYAAAGLAKRAIQCARGVVRFDRVKGADLHALIAGDAGGLDLPLSRPEEVPEREKCSTRTNVLAPKTLPQKAQAEDQDKQEDGNKMAGIEASVQIPAFD